MSRYYIVAVLLVYLSGRILILSGNTGRIRQIFGHICLFFILVFKLKTVKNVQFVIIYIIEKILFKVF